MDSTNASYGHTSLLGSIILGIVSWFTPQNIDLTLKIMTGIGAFISAIFAIRYYILAAKEKKQQIEMNEKKLRG